MQKIKGSCEHCGFNYKGSVKTDGVHLPESVKCPNCGQQSFNFDEFAEVTKRDKHEKNFTEYVESTFN